MKEQIESVLQSIRTVLQADGGDVELVPVTDDGIVHVRLRGTCAGCPLSQITLAQTVEATLKDKVPGVTKVEAVS